jgi:hypothetical protein
LGIGHGHKTWKCGGVVLASLAVKRLRELRKDMQGAMYQQGITHYTYIYADSNTSEV